MLRIAGNEIEIECVDSALRYSNVIKDFNSSSVETIEIGGKTIEGIMLPRILFALLWHCLTLTHANKVQQKILSIEANCTRDLMQIKINMGRPFKGMVFAKGFSEECGSVAGN